MIWTLSWEEQAVGISTVFLVAWVLNRCFASKPVPEHFDSWRQAHREKISKEGLKYNRAFLDRKRNVKKFPPPYPNTWYYALRSEELKVGEVKPLQLVGKELVAFRNQDGEVGILDAFCPHLGAHLGHGGRVNKDGHLVCPFHEWKFDTKGKTQHIPYCKKELTSYSAIDNSAYPVSEKYGMIFFWYHVDREKPRFDVDIHTIREPANRPTVPLRKSKDLLFEMHMMEPSLNTQDWYHFSTTHATYPGFKLLRLFHKVLDVEFFQDGTFTFFEEVEGSFCSLPKGKFDAMKNQIRFCGPGIAVICSQLGRNTKYTFACFTPIEPFRTKVTFTTLVSPGTLWWLVCKAIAYTEEETVKQDLEVWEHKSNPNPRRLVQGDGPGFNQYRKWLEQFYTETSYKQVENLEW